MDEQTKILYSEILERFNKIIWTHKIHLCQANIYLSKKKKQNQILLVFSVLVSTSAITNIFKWLPETVIVPLMAFFALTLTYFTTKYKAENLEKKAVDNERFAAIMHDLRNKYAGFLSDIKAELYTKEQISKKRIELEHIENYRLFRACSTNFKRSSRRSIYCIKKQARINYHKRRNSPNDF